MNQKLSFFITLTALVICADAFRVPARIKGIFQKKKPDRNERTYVKEIIDVKLFNADKMNSIARNPENLYVEFNHRGEIRGKSMTFDSLHSSSLTNLPLLADTEGLCSKVRCTIKREIPMLEDEGLLKCHFDLRKVENGEVWANLTTMSGRHTGASMRVNVFDNEWVGNAFSDSDGTTNPPDARELYYKALASTLDNVEALSLIEGIDQLKRPSQAANPNLPTIKVLEGLIEYPKTDEFVKSFLKNQLLKAAPLGNKVPFEDTNSPVGDRATMTNELRRDLLKDLLEEPAEGKWVSPLSDESMHRVFFCNVGMWFLNKRKKKDKEGNLYVADMTFLSFLSYRRNYENLGCRVFFDKEAHITKIEDYDGTIYRPGDEKWEWAKQKARTNAFVTGALVDLCYYHLKWGNIPAMAMRKFLPPDHAWRIDMTSHFFGTHDTCLLVKDLLIAEHGPLHRGLPFDYERGYKKIYERLLHNFEYEEYPDELEKAGLKDDKYHLGSTDGLCFRKAVMNYVSNLVDELYPEPKKGERDPLEDDRPMRNTFRYLVDELKIPSPRSAYTRENVKLVWGEIIFRVTGAHTSIGNAVAFATEPFMINFRMNDEGKVVANMETLTIVSVIQGLTTPAEYPGVKDDWRHLLHDPLSEAYRTFKEDLDLVKKEIDQRNKVRRFNNCDFHPDTVMISVFA